MGLITKILKNNTVLDIDLADAGARVAASGSYTVPPELYPLFAASANGGDLESEINSGDITVNNGITDLDSDLGIAHMRNTIYEGVGSPQLVTGLTCDSSVQVGDFVRFDGATLVRALATTHTNSRVLGLVEHKFNSTTCDVRISGVGGDIFVGLDTSKDYFLSSTVLGGITTTPPSGDENVVFQLGRPLTATRFVVNLGWQIEIDTD